MRRNLTEYIKEDLEKLVYTTKYSIYKDIIKFWSDKAKNRDDIEVYVEQEKIFLTFSLDDEGEHGYDKISGDFITRFNNILSNKLNKYDSKYNYYIQVEPDSFSRSKIKYVLSIKGKAKMIRRGEKIIPDRYIYHATSREALERIKSDGYIKPKMLDNKKWRYTDLFYDKQVFFTQKGAIWKEMLNMSIIMKIDTTLLPKGIKFYFDSNMDKSGKYITTDSFIPYSAVVELIDDITGKILESATTLQPNTKYINFLIRKITNKIYRKIGVTPPDDLEVDNGRVYIKTNNSTIAPYVEKILYVYSKRYHVEFGYRLFDSHLIIFEASTHKKAKSVRVKPKEKIYHLTKKSEVPSILSYGLIPSDIKGDIWGESTIDLYYRDRIFFTKYKDNMKEIMGIVKWKKDDSVILEIDTTKLNKNVVFFYDENYLFSDFSIYTNSPIPPEAIRVSE